MNLDGGTVAYHRQRHFLRARFPYFFLPGAHWSAAARSCDTATGQFARAKFNFLRPIDFFSFPFLLFSFFFFSFFTFQRDGIVKKEKKKKRKKKEKKERGS